MDQLKTLYKALRAEQRQARRGRFLLSSIQTLAKNHLGAFLLALGLANPPASTALLCILLLLILPALFRDPMHSFPKGRFQLMPLPPWKARAFPWIARLSNPLLLVILGLALWLDRRLLLLFPLGLWLPSLLEALLGKLSTTFKGQHRQRKPLLNLPFRGIALYLHFLKRHLQSLDVLASLMLSAWAIPHILNAGRPAMTRGVIWVLTIAMGTQAQRLLALEHPREGLRLRMMSIQNIQILLMANLAWMSIYFALTLPLTLPITLNGAASHSGLALLPFKAGLMALTLGNLASPQPLPAFKRWAFTEGPGLLGCVLQTLSVALVIFSPSPSIPTFVFLLGLWVASLAIGGRRMNRV